MTIIITKEHLTKMKQQLNERMHSIQKTFREEETYNMACWEEDECIHSVSDNDVLCELDLTYRLCDKIDEYIGNENFYEIKVESEAWFEEWTFKALVEVPTFDREYMFPRNYKLAHTCDNNI